MTDHHQFDMTPRAEFADRLEADLRRAIEPSHDASREDHIVQIQTTSQPHRPSRVPWIIAAAAVVLGVVGVTVAFARNGESSSSSTLLSPTTTISTARSVTFTIDWPADAASVDCATTSALVCFHHLPIPGVAPFKGDVDGTSYLVALWNDADVDATNTAHREYIATYMVSATVKGCGTGRFMLEEYLQDTWPNDHQDQVTVHGTWTIAPGSGRSLLSKLSGQGTSTAGPDGPRTLTGTIDCG